MKHLLVLLTVWSVQGWAQNTCSSVWVYKPYLTCGQAASPNTSIPGTLIGARELESGWFRGGADQVAICASLEADFNGQPGKRLAGLVAKLTQPAPVREQDRKNVRTEYRYYCQVQVVQYPMGSPVASPECGVSDRYMYAHGSQPAPAGQTTCLSCDHLDGAKIEELVSCLQTNIRDVVNARAVELRAEDLQPMKVKVARILEMSKAMPISNLQSFEQISLFIDFVK